MRQQKEEQYTPNAIMLEEQYNLKRIKRTKS